jgi:hypothetical protein
MRCKKLGFCGVIMMVILVLIAVAIGSFRGCMYKTQRSLWNQKLNPLPRELFGMVFGQDAVNLPPEFELSCVSTCVCGVTKSAEYVLGEQGPLTFGSALITNCVVDFLSTTLGEVPRWALYRIQFDVIPTKNFLMVEGVDLGTIKTAIEEKYGMPTRQTAFAYFWQCKNGITLEMKKGTLGIGLDNPIIWTYPETERQHWAVHESDHRKWITEKNRQEAEKKASDKKAVLDDL